ncbi:hybrid sensor histidine kinase/response regulator [Planktothricoides sp. FACHB-1370]|uniref:histidine kinase n=2 Tax=Planktothricoides raciborskii TaxID=132608 RepID=A0ABR8EEL8_9CYAN|nr:hybrid sensor histidine kinase/response regulator [Planktothricoides raciborskii FACHB-1370]MBD2583248.1 hybrid sensor histidine kinase/response regulator [Planktothricoides raciborskii FACHB-1261]
MMIEDDELRTTFQFASEEHLQKLDEGLLYLEKHPEDQEKLAEMMREAHSLKGDAGMLGVKDVATLAHQWEHLLGTLKDGEASLREGIYDRLYSGLDAIRKLVQEAITGEPSGVNTFYALAELMGAKSHSESPESRANLEASSSVPSSVPPSVSDEVPPPAPIPSETSPVSPEVPEIIPPPVSLEPGSTSSLLIDDEELRMTFKFASEDHLQKLDEGLLYLETHPQNQEKLAEMLREAHSLKGDAGMLGVKDVATLAHEWEHLLGSLKEETTFLTGELCDRLYFGLNAIRQLVHEAITGEPSGINVPDVLAQLTAQVATGNGQVATGNRQVAEEMRSRGDEELSLPGSPAPPLPGFSGSPAADGGDGGSPVPSSLDNNIADSSYERKTSDLEPFTSTQSSTSSRTGAYRIESIRVETRNLDELMTQAGELTVTKSRINHRLAEVEEIVSLWEEWNRDVFVNRFCIDEVVKGNRNGSVEQLKNFHHRTEDRLQKFGELISSLRSSIYEDTARLDLIVDELEEGIRTLRLLPMSTIVNLFPRMVRELAKEYGKQVNLILEGAETRADKLILEEMKDPLIHIIRNAVDHGIETPKERIQQGKPETATIRIKCYQTTNNIIIEVSDDGQGLDLEKIKQTALKRGICRPDELANMTTNQIQALIFAPGFSTRTFVTEVSGRGVGLDVVRTNVERLKGAIAVHSTPGKGCTLRLQLGTTLATAHVLLVQVDQLVYALPVEAVQMAKFISKDEIFSLEGRKTMIIEGQPISVARLSDLLPINSKIPEHLRISRNHTRFETKSHQEDNTNSQEHKIPCIILQIGEERLGLLVDALIDEQDVVLKPQSKLLKRVRNISGATILGTGEVCMVLNPQDLIKSVRQQAIIISDAQPLEEKITEQRKKVILLVEDSIATRTQEKRILQSAGYEVVTAVDGLDGWNKLKTRQFDAVVSDIQMPNLDGLGLTTKIRQHKEYSELPIILVTSLAKDDDKRRGAEAGANAYITKSSFNQQMLLETIERLI